MLKGSSLCRASMSASVAKSRSADLRNVTSSYAMKPDEASKSATVLVPMMISVSFRLMERARTVWSAMVFPFRKPANGDWFQNRPEVDHPFYPRHRRKRQDDRRQWTA